MSTDRRAIRKSLRTSFDPSPRERLRRVSLRARQAAHAPALLRGVSLDEPIFVIGAPRSGTSLLYSILNKSSRVAHWPGEAHEVWEADHHPALLGWESNVLGAEDATDAVTTRIRREFFLVTGRSRRLIEKSPRNILRIEFVDAIFPDARYVYLTRDGRDNVNSLINAWRTPRYRTYELPEPHAIPGADPRWWKFILYPGWRDDVGGPLEVVCARQWVEANNRALDASKSVGLDRWVEVRYEDLVDDPEAEIGRILEFLGLPYERELKERAAKVGTTPINVVTPPERGKWQRENPEEIAAILPLIEPTMRALGYELDEH